MRPIGLLLAAIVVAIALWLVFANPRLDGGRSAPTATKPVAPPSAANTMTPSELADAAAQKAEAAAKEKAAKAKAVAIAAQRAEEAAQADALEQNMTPAQNRLNEDYAAQVGDTRPAASTASNSSTSPDPSRP